MAESPGSATFLLFEIWVAHYAFSSLKPGKISVIKNLRNTYQVSRDWLQKPTEVLIYVLLAPAKRVLGSSGAGCVAGSAAAWGCCSPLDASVGERSLAAAPGLAGASCLQRGCTAAVLVHGCGHCAPLQSSRMAAILMHDCNHLAQLQYLCTAIILMHLCDHHAWLQGLVHGYNPCGWLQSPCTAAILADSCAGVALGRWKGIDYRGLAQRGSHTLISQSSPAPPCLSPGQWGSPGNAALGLEQTLAGSGATPCRPPCTAAIY